MNDIKNYKYLNKLRNILVEKQYQINDIKHYIPINWIDKNNFSSLVPVNFPQFLVNKIDEVLNISNNLQSSKKKRIRIYNSLVRLTTAFDLRQNTSLLKSSLPYFKSKGTFIKTIALLPYLKDLGITHLYLLPITEIGIDGKKGTLGSPYSIKNHKKIDENLSEPILEMSVEEQFKALIEACHILDIKIILEMVFRTASKDNDLIVEHPEWFYWIKSDSSLDTFKPPKFNKESLTLIKNKVENKDFNHLIEPNNEYKNLYCNTPIKVWKEENKIYGLTEENVLCEVPGAFADWPPDDSQPLWSDVTYLKLHNHPKFNYIAYNTVRMYDEELNQPQYINQELWDYLAGIIPFYINEYDIDGVMVDMGHALPNDLLEQIVKNAKNTKNDFLFLEENFIISNASIDKGFDIVVGYLPFDLHKINETNKIINELNKPDLKIKYFGTAETHNTPRAMWRTNSKNFSVYSYLLSNLLQNAIPFINNGFELLEKHPINTGLDFEVGDLNKFPILPLFDYSELNWINPEGNIINEICEINNLIDSNSFEIVNSQILNDYILQISLKYNNKNAYLLVNYGKNANKIIHTDYSLNKETAIFSLDVEVTNFEILFNSSFAFIMFLVD